MTAARTSFRFYLNFWQAVISYCSLVTYLALFLSVQYFFIFEASELATYILLVFTDGGTWQHKGVQWEELTVGIS